MVAQLLRSGAFPNPDLAIEEMPWRLSADLAAGKILPAFCTAMSAAEQKAGVDKVHMGHAEERPRCDGKNPGSRNPWF
jgi:hypothetical protein